MKPVRFLLFLFLILTAGSTLNVFAGNLRDVRLRGILLKSDGSPLPETDVELLPTDRQIGIPEKIYPATTSISGKFSFLDVPPGKYTLSINFNESPTEKIPYPTVFYPQASKRSDSKVFEITGGGRVEDITFKLPAELVPVKITGTALGEDGHIVEGTLVSISDMGFDEPKLCGTISPDSDGKFAITGFATRTYRITAISYAPKPVTEVDNSGIMQTANSEPKTLVLGSAAQPLKLILIPRGAPKRA